MMQISKKIAIVRKIATDSALSNFQSDTKVWSCKRNSPGHNCCCKIKRKLFPPAGSCIINSNVDFKIDQNCH